MTNLKKILMWVLVAVTVLVCGCSCHEEPDPTPVFPKEKDDVVYLNVKQGNITYDIYKNDMYINLKNKYGVGSIVDFTDTIVLKAIGKKDLYTKLFGANEKFEAYDNTPYWDLVKLEDITSALEKDKAEIESEAKFKENFAMYGYNTQEEIEDYYHAKLAKLLLAKDYQELYRSSIDFENTEYQTLYISMYRDNYYMILIPFEGLESYSATLRTLGIKIQNGSTKNAKWLWEDTNEALTVNEVIEAFIAIYNNSSIFKASATENEKLVEGVDYEIKDGKYIFNTENEGKLFYSTNDVRYLDSNLLSTLNNEFVEYGPSSTNEVNDWYWAQGRQYNEKYYTCLMLKKVLKTPYEETKPLLREVLMEKEVTDDYANDIMVTIRQIFGLAIYDRVMQENYKNTYGLDSIPTINIDNGDYVFAFNEVSYKKDELFNIMDKRFGAQTSIELINYYNALYNPEINDVYDLTKEKEADRILNRARWEYAWETAEMEKSDFENGTYTKYGYEPSYGWENFLEAVYNVRSTQELAYNYLRENCLYDYLTKKYNISLYGESSSLWTSVDKLIKEKADNNHYANGYAVRIFISNGDGTSALTSDYSESQKALVKEFYSLLAKYFNQEEDPQEAYDSLKEIYDLCAYNVGENVSTVIFNNMDLSKYKTAGLMLGIENLGTFNFETVEENLGKVAKEIWENNTGSKEKIVYGLNEGEYIEGERSYFVYVNTSNPVPNNYEGRNYPTYEECSEYLTNFLASKDQTLTEEQQYLVTSLFMPIYRELIGIYNTAYQFYTNQANYEVTFKFNNFTKDDYIRILSIVIDDCKGQLEYPFN